jgi:hypothetical protein
MSSRTVPVTFFLDFIILDAVLSMSACRSTSTKDSWNTILS